MPTVRSSTNHSQRELEVLPQQTSQEMPETNKIEIGTYGHVELIDNLQNDLSVVNAARVSMDVEHEAMMKRDPGLLRYLARERHFTPFGHARHGYECYIPDVDKMIKWLMNRQPGWTIKYGNNKINKFVIEGSLFNWFGDPHDLPPIRESEVDLVRGCLIDRGCEFTARAFLGDKEFDRVNSKAYLNPVMRDTDWLTFRIKAPVFVLRQWMRSNWEIIYNEVSRRYVSGPPEFYFPHEWRSRPPEDIKQGSGDLLLTTYSTEEINKWIGKHGSFPFAVDLRTSYSDLMQTAGEMYTLMIDSQVAPEMARMVLPLSMYSEIWMTISPKALERVQGLRSNRGESNHAQKEIEEFSRAVESLIA